MLALIILPGGPRGAADLLHSVGISHPLLKVLLPVASIVAVVIICRVRQISLARDLRLVAPPLGPLLGWLGLGLLWMLGTDYALHWRGAWDFAPWRTQGLAVSGARVLAVGVLGPLAEELIFRGIVYFRLRRAGLSEWLVIALIAAGWAMLHVDYSLAVIAVIGGFGVLLGAARGYTGSLWVPVALHIAWNLYAVW
jgi:membrane protease YdiL (CAAX protease family)